MSALSDSNFDVVIIGGGVNGTGIARDCAYRGYSTCLLEQRDLAAGASGANSGMIHGGARYMIADVATTKKSCEDSGYIQQMAPHMLFRIPFLMPIMQKGIAGRIYGSLFETYFEGYDQFQPLKNGKPHTRLTTDEAVEVEPGLVPKINGAVTMDEWGIDPFRLCAANALSAAEAGAIIRNHVRVESFVFEGEKVAGVRAEDYRTGKLEEIRARVVFNAAGPWVLKVLEGSGASAKMRPGKGVHVILDRRVVNVAIMCSAVDGRSIFIMPHDNSTIIGTTDDDFYGDPDNITVSKDEVEYLLQGIERVLPQVRSARIVRVMAGVRPTLHKWGPNEDELSRDHKVYDHGAQDGVKGLFSMVGGKLAAYRIMSEDATDMIGEYLQQPAPCTTHGKPLPGGEKELDLSKLAEKTGFSEYALARINFRHGSRTEDIAALCKERPGLQRIVCACEPVTAAELTYSIRSEWAAKLSDLRRRTRLGTGPCQGCRCTLEAGCVLADELGHSGAGQLFETYDFLRNRWKGKVPILEGEQVAQEELLQQTYLRTLGMGHFLEDEGPFEGWRTLAPATKKPAPVRARAAEAAGE